jgi:hypothetical protein
MIKEMADAVVQIGHERRGLRLRQHRRLLAGEPRRQWQHCRRSAAFSARHESGRRLHSFARTEVRGLFRRRHRRPALAVPAALATNIRMPMQYAAWGVDYLKYDWCSTTTQDAKASYANIRAALDASGRPIVLSICEWGTAKPWLMGQRSRRQPVAHVPATSRIAGAASRNGRMAMLLERSDGSSISRSDCNPTPDRGTGTILTCSKSATAV